MHVEFDTPDHAAIIERLLDGFISAGELLIRAGAVGRPELDVVLADDEVVSWQLPTQTSERKRGDCEDLVIWWAAWLRATGKYPRARARIRNTGPMQVHCLLDKGDGSKPVDVYQDHLDAQKRAGFEMGGLWSSIKHGVSSVGHGISSVGHGISKAAHAVGHAAEATYHGVGKAAGAVKDAAHYVAHDLPGAIIHEGVSGLTDVVKGVAGGAAELVHGLGDAGSTVINAVGDEVARGAGDALHQWGKLGDQVAESFSSDGGGVPDQGVPDQGVPDQGAGFDPGEAGGVPYDGDDPFAGMEDTGDDWEGDEADAASDYFEED